MKGIFLGVLPPPYTGMTIATSSIVDALSSAGELEILTFSKGAGMKRVRWIFKKYFMFLYLSIKLPYYKFKGADCIYLISESAYGLLSTLYLLLLCRVLKFEVHLHHHVYSYITRKTFLMSRVSKFKNVTHVFLAQKMANDFVSVYRSDVKSLICSNAFVLSPATKINSESAIEQDDNAGVVFGFLSNITTEKGFFELIDIFSSASEHVKDIRLIIAGPVTDLVCQEYLNGASSNVNVEYIGAIYGEEKLKFYQNIDVFLFPTLYKNEAQPLVLYEAINSGTPVLSYDRGCIYEQLYGSELSMVVSGKEEMLLRIVDLANNSELLGAFNNCAVQLNEQLISKSKNELDCFVTSFYRR